VQFKPVLMPCFGIGRNWVLGPMFTPLCKITAVQLVARIVVQQCVQQVEVVEFELKRL